jgi:hypothetical protein
MISCLNEVTMQAYFDGELEPEIAAQVNQHLVKCDTCAASAFEFERAIELMASAFEDELPDSVPSDRLRARIDSALVGDSLPELISPAVSFWRQILNAVAGLKSLELSPRRLAYASLAVLVLIFGLWLSLRTGSVSQKQDERAGNEEVQKPAQSPSTTPGEGHEDGVIADEQTTDKSKTEEAPKLVAPRRSPPQKQYAGVKRESPITPPNETDNPGELLAGTTDAGIFGEGMVRHFEKAQILLRSFRNSDTSSEGFNDDLAHEKLQSKSLLYTNILLRRDAETNGNLPAEDVLGSLEPVLLDIANLPDKPSPDEVRSIKDRIHKMEIIAVLQVYSSPLTAANYQPQ